MPVIVRQKSDRFELISGHRRKHACELLGHDEIACRIVEASDDEAIIMMVDSNCQRTKLLPSERAFAYKMKLEAKETPIDAISDKLGMMMTILSVIKKPKVYAGLSKEKIEELYSSENVLDILCEMCGSVSEADSFEIENIIASYQIL